MVNSMLPLLQNHETNVFPQNGELRFRMVDTPNTCVSKWTEARLASKSPSSSPFFISWRISPFCAYMLLSKLLSLQNDRDPAHATSLSPYLQGFEKPERNMSTHLLPTPSQSTFLPSPRASGIEPSSSGSAMKIQTLKHTHIFGPE